MLLAVDPGRDKIGLAVVDLAGTLCAHQVVATAELARHIASLLEGYEIARILVGDGTGSGPVVQVVRRAVEASPRSSASPLVHIVEETDSTLRARALYFVHNPPRGLLRLVPRGLLLPPRPYDDFAAYVLACDYLKVKACNREAASSPRT